MKKKNANKIKIETPVQKINIIDNKQIAKETIENDIEDRIMKLKLNKDMLNLPLEFIIESFIKIFTKEIIRQKDMLKNEYEVFITDRLHKLLYTDDMNEISQIALEEKYIEEKRADIKRELNLYEPFKEIIEDLLNDEVFKVKFNLALEKYEKTKKTYDNPVYITNTLSMQDLDFTIKSKNDIVKRKLIERKPLKRFYASVPCNNLYGNPGKTLFEANNGIIAEDEEKAKERLKEILKQFNNIFYNEKDIIIKEVE